MSSPGPAYSLERTNGGPSHVGTGSMDYSEVGTEQDSGVGVPVFRDATNRVHEMHLALLYLLSNPEEFKKAIHTHATAGATTLADWNAEYDDDTDNDGESQALPDKDQTPLPFVVFAEDAEVVLPQAHTASQLFGLERVEGIELEAAAGVEALSQLFLRWLALMPGGDHLNIIDPPGLTVMRIAGGRYRVTAAHRVIWTWMNEFPADAFPMVPNADGSPPKELEKLAVGDLVTMTIVDVFETDNNGKLLSYCPTFDNRAIHKTTQASETIRKGSSKIRSSLTNVAKSTPASRVSKAAAMFTRFGINAAKNVTEKVKHQIGEHQHSRKQPEAPAKTEVKDAKEFEDALNEAAGMEREESNAKSQEGGNSRGEHYFSDDDTTEAEGER